MKRQGTFPFTASIGQEEMKKALVLNVVNPRLGGVLIQGEKGTAKSTACCNAPRTSPSCGTTAPRTANAES